VASLHRSQISQNFDFKDYVVDAGSGSRIVQHIDGFEDTQPNADGILPAL
jgi:hypothetical protein